jgi:hypothetical protein
MEQPKPKEPQPPQPTPESGRKGAMVGETPPVPAVPDDEFEAAAEYAYRKNAELMRRLG